MVIIAKTKIKDALKEHPQLKEVLIKLSPKFKKLNNPVIYKLVARWATFGDIARTGGFSVCELLHTVNKEIGTEKELFELAPECIKESKPEVTEKKPEWVENIKQTVILDVREREGFFLPEITSALKKLREDQILLVTNSFYPAPLVKMLTEQGHKIYYEAVHPEEHRLYIKKKIKSGDWRRRKEDFEILDVRGWKTDPFSAIIKKANEISPGEGFRLIQFFLPGPLINMIEPLGFETLVEQKGANEFHIYFFKKEEAVYSKGRVKGRIPLVIQSATPVVYPIVMKLLQSRELMSRIKIEELKVWDKTEKHLGWILNGRADISFSAVAAVANLFQKGLDIKMKSIIVWDNFYILTRGFKAEGFEELKGHSIYLPLIKAAPPYAVTIYLIKALGLDLKDFNFEFGNGTTGPFGRPSEIKNLLLNGEINAALLREPEASFAIYEGKGKVHESFAYRDAWKNLFPGQGNLPNAGLLFKGEILREYPDVAELFMAETRNAVRWINSNRKEATKLSYDIMKVSPEETEMFLFRANFDYRESEESIRHIINYLEVLNKSGYGRKAFGELEPLFL
ncbi:MAG: DUF2249 domain-containing protein [Spirochaetales bacterium]|nr:DUF2249 domain-containing protein [Spirochaetales bacterium]